MQSDVPLPNRVLVWLRETNARMVPLSPLRRISGALLGLAAAAATTVTAGIALATTYGAAVGNERSERVAASMQRDLTDGADRGSTLDPTNPGTIPMVQSVLESTAVAVQTAGNVANDIIGVGSNERPLPAPLSQGVGLGAVAILVVGSRRVGVAVSDATNRRERERLFAERAQSIADKGSNGVTIDVVRVGNRVGIALTNTTDAPWTGSQVRLTSHDGKSNVTFSQPEATYPGETAVIEVPDWDGASLTERLEAVTVSVGPMEVAFGASNSEITSPGTPATRGSTFAVGI